VPGSLDKKGKEDAAFYYAKCGISIPAFLSNEPDGTLAFPYSCLYKSAIYSINALFGEGVYFGYIL
jgi:hypothetical protein